MNKLNGWKYTEVIDFIRLHGFILDHNISGSHEFWVLSTNKEVVINVNYEKSNYPIRTLETMIRQSRIPKKHWIKYSQIPPVARKNKKCCK